MDNSHKWWGFPRLLMFILGTGFGFGILVLLGLLLSVSLYEPQPTPPVLVRRYEEASCVISAIFGALTSQYYSVWFSRIHQNGFFKFGGILKSDRVAQDIRKGPSGTYFFENSEIIMVKSGHLSRSEIIVFMILSTFGIGLSLVTWFSSSTLQAISFLTSYCTLGYIVIYGYSMADSTVITITSDKISIAEGPPWHKKYFSVDRSRISKCEIYRFPGNRSTITKGIITDSNKKTICAFGSNLSWKGLCYLVQVLDEIIVNKKQQYHDPSIKGSLI
jgi:hypothetical protein